MNGVIVELRIELNWFERKEERERTKIPNQQNPSQDWRTTKEHQHTIKDKKHQYMTNNNQTSYQGQDLVHMLQFA